MKKQNIFDFSKSLIYGQREKDYGHPKENMRRISILWESYLRAKYGDDSPAIDADDVCAMMRLLKEARLMTTPGHFDSLADVQGYAGVQYRVHEE